MVFALCIVIGAGGDEKIFWCENWRCEAIKYFSQRRRWH